LCCLHDRWHSVFCELSSLDLNVHSVRIQFNPPFTLFTQTGPL
jgi:hypothetical protein